MQKNKIIALLFAMHLGSIKFSFTLKYSVWKKQYSEFRVRKRSPNHTVTNPQYYIICVMKEGARLSVYCLPVCLSVSLAA